MPIGILGTSLLATTHDQREFLGKMAPYQYASTQRTIHNGISGTEFPPPSTDPAITGCSPDRFRYVQPKYQLIHARDGRPAVNFSQLMIESVHLTLESSKEDDRTLQENAFSHGSRQRYLRNNTTVYRERTSGTSRTIPSVLREQKVA